MAKKIIKKESAVEAVVIPDVCFDVKNVIEVLKSRGVDKSISDIAHELGYTLPGLDKLRKKAPKGIATLFQFLKENMLNIDDFIKEVKPK